MADHPEAEPLEPAPDARHDRASLTSRRATPEPFDLTPLEPVSSATLRRYERWRRTLGLSLLFTTVILWTASNFLASTLFADDTYSKPFLVTYVNTSFFILPLMPMLAQKAWTDPASITTFFNSLRGQMTAYRPLGRSHVDTEAFLKPDSPRLHARGRAGMDNGSMMDSHTTLLARPPAELAAPSIRSMLTASSPSRLTLAQTSRLGLEFCMLWFLANYTVAACLEYTTVASSTILTSTSSIFTLLFGILFKVETFSVWKLVGVLSSLAGIILISSVDLSGSSDENRGSFPHKTIREIGIGDALALVSAVLYGIYAVFMKKRIRDETRVYMPLFFGLVGIWNVALLWPGFLVLHYTGVETFELPPTGRVTFIILANSVSSLVSDFAWAYAVLLTSPIVVTVGLSTTIPLSLIGQMILNGQNSSVVYWIGALIVVGSFVVVNREEKVEDTHGGADIEIEQALAAAGAFDLAPDSDDETERLVDESRLSSTIDEPTGPASAVGGRRE